MYYPLPSRQHVISQSRAMKMTETDQRQRDIEKKSVRVKGRGRKRNIVRLRKKHRKIERD